MDKVTKQDIDAVNGKIRVLRTAIASSKAWVGVCQAAGCSRPSLTVSVFCRHHNGDYSPSSEVHREQP